MSWKRLPAWVHEDTNTMHILSSISFLSLNVRKAYDSTLLCLFLLCSGKKIIVYTLKAKEHRKGLVGASLGTWLFA